jgi:hypothetical protein
LADRDTTSLFTETLNVINAAMAKHADSALLKPLLSAGEKLLEDREIGVAIYDSDASAPFDYFTIRCRDRSFELVSHGKKHPDVTWKVSRDYLEKVADNPQDYIDNPIKLDWDWLRSRLGQS